MKASKPSIALVLSCGLLLMLLLLLCDAPSRCHAADVRDTMAAINQATRGTGYGCKTVSWEDAQRAVVDGALSVMGPNIADVRLWEKSGQLLYTVRSDSWNERLAYVKPRDLAVVVGNQNVDGELESVNFQTYLENFGRYGGYVGVHGGANLYEPHVDEIVSVRFQTVFLEKDSLESVKLFRETTLRTSLFPL